LSTELIFDSSIQVGKKKRVEKCPCALCLMARWQENDKSLTDLEKDALITILTRYTKAIDELTEQHFQLHLSFWKTKTATEIYSKE